MQCKYPSENPWYFAKSIRESMVEIETTRPTHNPKPEIYRYERAKFTGVW